jgi:cell division protein FtsW
MNDNGAIIKRVHFDYVLIIVTAMLVMIGIIMVYSSSAVLARERMNDGYYFLKKEIVFAGIGFAMLVIASKVPYQFWRKMVYPILGFAFILLILSFVPGLKNTAGGASRWIKLGPVTFQPSEFAKFALIIFLAYSLEKKASRIKSFGVGFVSNAAVAAVLILMVLVQKDLGAAFMLCVITALMMFVAGVRLSYLGASLLSAIPAIYFLVASVGYRRKRVLAFLDPWSDRYGTGFQIIQSLVSFNEGGIFGKGLGEGQQKLFYLPEAHTDFIFSVLGEELGLIGVLVVIGLFMVFFWRAVLIGLKAPDLFGRYLAFGLSVFIGVQALFNICVVMGLLPTKGLVLPFISYGGSALTTFLIAVGVLLNISTYKVNKKEA